ncbi:quinon protein alcohol dehydrogenase-like superfamily [Crassisporium funariophilum]|nr:quinon protein alcohol dehydrogenase-like superfamily [Crassisporium funariophilum]
MAASTSKQPYPGAQANKNKQPDVSKKGKGKESIPEPVATVDHSQLWEGSSRGECTTWDWTSLTDPSSGRVPPVFTKDGSYFFALVGSSVKIYSTTSGLVVSTLTAPTSSDGRVSSDMLTSAIINPHNAFQLITGSLDGRLIIWDFVNATLLQIIEVGQPIHYICAHEQFKGYVFVAASRPRKKVGANDNNAVVLRVFFKATNHTSQPPEILPIGKTRFPTGLAVSSNGAWLVATAGHKVYIAKTSALSAGFTKYVSPERLTCLAFHPVEEYFATGDEKGVIRLWYCLNDNLAVNARGVEKRTQTTSLHWHAHAVSSLAFTSNGAYLTSGGEESVLVIWQLHTGKKEFVARVGAPISTVSVSRPSNGEEEYLLGLADATYTFVSSATLKITRSYSRIKVDPAISYEWPSTSNATSVPLAVQPLTSTLVLPSSHPSSLQMYQPLSSTLVCELEVSASNRVSRRDDKPIIPSRVEKAVVSASGSWMATLDRREGDVGFRTEIYLKIWSWLKEEQNWVLNTRIDRPHGIDKVTDVSFSPMSSASTRMHLATTGEDGRIRLWRLHQTDSGSVNNVWTSSATLSFRSEIPRSISWSPDASLFAVAVGPHIAIFDPITGSLRQTLTSSESLENHSAHFIGNSGRHLLAVGAKCLVLWDLVKSHCLWQSNTMVTIDRVVPHPREDTFAVFHSSAGSEVSHTYVSIFGTTSNKPTSTRSVPFGLKSVVWSPLRRCAGYSLVGVTHNWRVVTFGDSQLHAQVEGSTARELNVENHPQRRTLFRDIFGSSAFAEGRAESIPASSSVSTQARLAKGSESDEIFGDPAYLTSPLDNLFNPLMKLFLTTRISESSTPKEHLHSEDEEDVMMEDEVAEPLVLTTRPPRITNQGEMEMFTKLFRTSSLAVISPAVSKANGMPNRMQHEETNGRSGKPVPPKPHASKQTPSSVEARQAELSTDRPQLPPPTPMLNGKKRKKSLG